MRFKDFLAETILVKDGNTIIRQSSERTNTPNEISTVVKWPLYTSKKGDLEVFSALNYKHSDANTEMLKALKGQGSAYPLARPQDRADLLNDAAKGIAKKLTMDGVETIVVASSTGSLVKDLAAKLEALLPKVKFVHGAISKHKFPETFDFSKLIDTSNPAWEKLNAASQKSLVQALKRSARETGHISMKDIYKQHGKFVKDFLKVEDIIDDVTGKKVAVLDDVLSSGSTMLELARRVRDLEPTSVVGITMFKRDDA